MKKIFIRSPYFIEVDEAGQSSAKIEVFLWNKGTTEPTTPNYTFTKNVPSLTQTKLSWNISNLAKTFIKPIAPVSVSVPTEENVNTWCYMKVKRYSDDVLLDTETFVCLNGYTSYMTGYNDSTTDEIVVLTNANIKRNIDALIPTYINVWFDLSDKLYYWLDGVNQILIDDNNYLYKIPINNTGVNILVEAGVDFPEVDDSIEIFRINTEIICEPKYSPLTCSFINRFGGWEYLTFFKANTQNINVTSKDYNLLPNSIDYNIQIGQKKRFNFQGKRSIKCNTGWVDENYSELIQDLLLSEVVLLDNEPAIVKSQSFDIKTHLKDKNINYEIEFEFNYGLINDVI